MFKRRLFQNNFTAKSKLKFDWMIQCNAYSCVVLHSDTNTP